MSKTETSKMTVAELRAELGKAGRQLPAGTKKAELVTMVEDLRAEAKAPKAKAKAKGAAKVAVRKAATETERHPTFWDVEYPDGFTCRVCAETKQLSGFPVAKAWSEEQGGGRSRNTECRTCRDERLGAEGRGPKALAAAKRAANKS